MKKEGNKFFYGVGIIFFVIDVITLGRFLTNGIVIKFWSPEWFIGVASILILFAFGVVFFNMSSMRDEKANKAILMFGLLFLFLSIVSFSLASVIQVVDGLKAEEYFGYLSMQAVVLSVGYLCTVRVSAIHLKYPSYAYVVVSTILFSMMIIKYLFLREDFLVGRFVGELFLLIVGSFLFVFMYGRFGDERIYNAIVYYAGKVLLKNWKKKDNQVKVEDLNH